MEVVAKTKGVRISPRKVRLVAQTVRRIPAELALKKLSLVRQRGADVLESTLKSAIANAINNKQLAKESLFVESVEVLEGPSLRRYRPSTRGRIHPYKKRSSHIKIILSSKEEPKEEVKKEKEEENGTES